MNIKIVQKTKSNKDAFGVFPVFEDEKSESEDIVKSFLKDNPKFGKLLETQVLYTPDQKILLVGAGKREKLDFGKLQNWAGTAARHLMDKAENIDLILPDVALSSEKIAEAVAIGVEMASHDPSLEYKSEKEPQKLKNVILITSKSSKEVEEGLKKGLIIGEGINLVRKLGDKPANEMTPTVFLSEAKRVARENNLKITVLDEAQAKKMGMGAFIGVAQGSEEPSYMIAIEYAGDPKTKEKWGIIGKGITFDSGGLSLKPHNSMHEMKYDMSGAGTVLATIEILSKLKVKKNVISIMAVTENLPGGRAQRPGDIVRTYSGKTAEILNTDAEGRLVLIDAVAWAQKDFKATKLIDLATLTGAIVVALGDFITGAFSNDPEFVAELIKTGTNVGEKYWEMPMDEEFGPMIKGEVGDITNIGHGGSMPGAAGSTTGAKFIQAGVKEGTPWIHLDIAGTAHDGKPKPYRVPGATGVGVKTLVELITQ